MSEKIFYSKSDVRRRLGVGRTRYAQLIAAGILPPPVELIAGARPVHTQAQVALAENNLLKQVMNNLQPASGRKSKPLSKKLIAELK